MSKIFKHLFTLLLFFFCIGQIVYAQVTFSKGWGPGKRAVAYGSDCRINTKAMALLFQTFMTDIKHLVTCDHQAAVNYLQTVEH